MLTPSGRKVGDASLSSPTDRRPCCACVVLPNPTLFITQMGIRYTKYRNPPLLLLKGGRNFISRVYCLASPIKAFKRAEW